jgi:hypothetical protein
MTHEGFVKATDKGYESASMEGKRALAVMTVTSEDIVFGVSSASFPGYPSVQQASRAAILDAIESAGKSQDELPKVILAMPTLGLEEEALEGIEEVVGKSTPIPYLAELRVVRRSPYSGRMRRIMKVFRWLLFTRICRWAGRSKEDLM